MRRSPAKTIDEYIEQFPEGVQKILREIRATIKKAAPGATEAIKYGIPTFVMNGNLVHFAAFQNHIGLYPAPRAIEVFKKELAVYQGGKGTVQFPVDEPIPYKLIEKIVKFRVQEAGAVKKPAKASGAKRSVKKTVVRPKNTKSRSN